MSWLRCALLTLPLLVQAAGSPPTFSADEKARIAALGPWPPPAALDAGNRWAGQPAAVQLGQQLFFDPRLSPDGRLACVSCHLPPLAFADGRSRSHGRVPLQRHAPSLWNAVHERWLGWDGAADSLWAQALRPLTDADELASNAAHLRRLFSSDAELACRWQRSFAAPPPADDDRLLVLAAKALGAFVGSLVSGRTPFDRFRDALTGGDARTLASAQQAYPAEAQRGLQLFVGRGRCHFCHAGPRFSNGEFADIGIGFFVPGGGVDSGRHGGIQALRRSPYTLLSAHADDPGEAATKTRHVQAAHRNFGEFKVPSLRNVALTAPYLHDGRAATLDDVIRHYSELDLERLHSDGERILEPLRLDAREHGDLRAFLQTLSDPAATRWQAPALPRCEAPGNPQ
ncbi:cytochrome-c peroxidase [Pseudorhodoferax sp.]|uniref:cytochrome-c peroxidase n=1 Tax=Pseudorhodoferax sp. TaxID=1993553 RepID=UPI002DD6A89C|nr:cytochrome c peroxidase [Pseudorhodoferax sp.]